MNLPFFIAFFIWLGIILLILYFWFEQDQTLFPDPIWWWQYIVFLRVPIIAALILLYFPLIATKSCLSDLLLISYCVIIVLCTFFYNLRFSLSRVKILVVKILLIFLYFSFNFFISLIDISPLFENLFVMTKSFQLRIVFVTITSTSLMVSLVFSAIFINVPIRYSKELGIEELQYRERYDHDKRRAKYTRIPSLINSWIYKLSFDIQYRYFLSILLSLPSWITIVYLSWRDAKINNLSDIQNEIKWGLLFSLLFYLIVFVLALIIKCTENTNIEFFFTRIWRKILEFREDSYYGYLRPVQVSNENKFQFEHGHVLGISLGSIGSIFYFCLGFKIVHLNLLPLDFPALMYLLLIIWVVTCLLGGATFYTDRYHVPLLTALILFSGFSYLIFNVDHFFKLNPVSIKNEYKNEHFEIRLDDTDKFYEKISDFKSHLKNRLAKQGKKDKTLVLVAASGGGIQAAGWTAQVLQGLNEELSNSFTDSIGMISSVSGGSVGNMFFLNELINSKNKNNGDKDLNSYLKKALNNSMKDSLDAVGWGLAYPDFFRAIGLPFFFDKYIGFAEKVAEKINNNQLV